MHQCPWSGEPRAEMSSQEREKNAHAHKNYPTYAEVARDLGVSKALREALTSREEKVTGARDTTSRPASALFDNPLWTRALQAIRRTIKVVWPS